MLRHAAAIGRRAGRHHMRQGADIGIPRKDRSQHAQFGHQADRAHRIARCQDIFQLAPNTLGRQPGEAIPAGLDRSNGSAIRPYRRHSARKIGKNRSIRKIIFGHAQLRVADKTHAPRSKIVFPTEIIMQHAALVERHRIDGESRRAASTAKSSVHATIACRPSVASSRRSVVISNGRPALSAVTVPCERPVGIARKLALAKAASTAFGASGVARSISATGAPANWSRTQPPTSLARGNAARMGAKPGESSRSGRLKRIARNDARAVQMCRHVGAVEDPRIAQQIEPACNHREQQDNGGDPALTQATQAAEPGNDHTHRDQQQRKLGYTHGKNPFFRRRRPPPGPYPRRRQGGTTITRRHRAGQAPRHMNCRAASARSRSTRPR